jgi:hypothetical protein
VGGKRVQPLVKVGKVKLQLVVLGAAPNRGVVGTVTGKVETGTESVEKVVVSKQPFEQVVKDIVIVVRL